MALIEADQFSLQRERMLNTQLRARGISDPRVLAAMAGVPRQEFVAEEYRTRAYGDFPLPIAEGQTVSQPYIVALMLEALALTGTETVLEVGTGSGYQTALLAQLARSVYSIERHEALAKSAHATLQRLGYQNVAVLVGDGSQGWPEKSPFDAIIVSAAAPHIPQPLFEQLREGGRMMIPVGPADGQELQLASKHDDRAIVNVLEGCRFVPLIGGQGYEKGRT
jgi:protein-L-isoaspartate(D-aspartate) O-methyltransferase